MKKWILPLGISLSLVACGGAEQKKDKEEKTTDDKNVRVEELMQKDFGHWIEVQGNVTSDQDVILSPQTAGIVTKIYVKEGQVVKRGAALASMDNDIVGANIQEVEQQIANADYLYQKQKELYAKGVGTEFDLTNAQNNLKSLLKRRKTLQVQAGKSGIYAPFSGIVDEIYPVQGETAAPGSPVIHLVSLNPLVVKSSVSEAYLNTIKEGTPVKIVFPSIGKTIDTLKVSRVSKYINPENRTYDFYIDIDNTEGTIVPNLTARIYVQDQFQANAKLVPSQAIQYDKNGNSYVFLAQGSDTTLVSKKVAVSTLFSYGNNTVIESASLKKGDKIVSEGAEEIEDKDKLNILK
jgi:RND family efflux transporter MFP subunit